MNPVKVIQSPYGPVKRSRVQVSSQLVNYRPFRNVIPVREDTENRSVSTVQNILCWSMLYFQFSLLSVCFCEAVYSRSQPGASSQTHDCDS